MTSNPIFLTKAQVLFLHQDLIETFGGLQGLRDERLLESALEMPQAGLGGKYFHQNLYAMAAAYLFHLVKNHPFIDGNKRIGLACADVFLTINHVTLTLTADAAYDITMRVTADNLSKEALALFFQQHSQRIII